MWKAAAILIAVICFWGGAGGTSKRAVSTASQPQDRKQSPGDKSGPSAIRLAIATVDPTLAPKDHYQTGEQVIVTIGMTNTSSQPGLVCLSSDLYQDLPILKKDGQLLPYTKWQTYLLRNAKRDQTCRRDDLPEQILLKTNE